MAWDKTRNTPEQLRAYYKKYYYEKRKAKLDKERAEHPTHKECPICKKDFVAKRNQVYCCEACKELATKLRKKMFRQTDKYKEAQARYRNSEKGQETRKAYYSSEHGKKVRADYYNSEKGKESRKKYYFSEKGQATLKRYWEKRKANGGLPLSQKPKKKK